jgi:hypothetical protein
MSRDRGWNAGDIAADRYHIQFALAP